MADAGETPEQPGGKRRASLAIVAAALLVVAVIGGAAALGSGLATTPGPDDGSTEPQGFLTIVGGSADEPLGLGPELLLRNLAETPPDSSARITATADNGESYTMFTVSPERPAGGDSLVFRGGADLGETVVALGPPPFRYAVELTLGDQTYLGSGTWPDGRVELDEPDVRLTFDPPLPAASK